MFNATASATEGDVQQVIPVGRTLSAFQVRLNGSPGVGTSYAFFVRKNGVNTTVTCTISVADTSCSDATNSVGFVAGDLISITSVPTGTPTARTMMWTAVMVP